MQRLGGQVIALVLAMASLSSSAAASGPGPNLPLRDPQVASYTTVGGVAPLASDITVPHWHGQFTDPTDGITYGYNMVGAEDPRNVDAGTTIVPVDLIPLRLSFEANNGFALDGTNDAALTVASPIFQPADYSWTARSFGGAGPLSAGNVGVQYEDAVMRSQFNKTASAYHLVLGGPNLLPTLSFS